jgi:hypothetical protein
VKNIEHIDKYINNILEKKKSINRLKGDRNIDSYKSILYFSLLESMAKAVYGKKFKYNGVRFKNFVKDFCEWEQAERVSLQQLDLLIDEDYSTNSTFQNVADYVKENLSNYSSYKPHHLGVPFSLDPTLEEIKIHWPKSEKHKVLNSYTHVSLLWKQRNNLSHENRSKSIPSLNQEYPHYSRVLLPGSEKMWISSYPINFFNTLVNNAIKNIRNYCIEKDINPFDNHDLSFLWR